MKKRTALTLVALLGIASGCNYSFDKTSETITDPPAASDTPDSAIGFQVVYDQVFSRSCTECHSEKTFKARGIGFDDYASTAPFLSAVQDAVATSRMPKNRPLLTPAQKELLFRWIAAGAPENGASTVTPPARPPQESAEPTPAPEPVPPTEPAPTPDPTPAVEPTPTPPPTEPAPVVELNFDLIREKVIAPRCLTCHSAAAKTAGIQLETFEAVQQVLKEVERAVSTNAMPLGEPLTAEQKEILLNWIAQGAKK